MKWKKRTIKIKGRKSLIAFTPWFKPYSKRKGKYYTNLREFTKARRGVYFIKRLKDRKIVYIGYSSNSLYRTLYRHFQKWNHKEKHTDPVVFPKEGYKIKIVLTKSSNVAELEKYYIRKFLPKLNLEKYEDQKPAVTAIDPTFDRDFSFVEGPPPF